MQNEGIEKTWSKRRNVKGEYMLSPDFKVSEFLNRGFAPVTTMRTVWEFQKLRDRAGIPVIIHGSTILDGKLLTTGDIKGADRSKRPAFRQIQSISAFNIPVYGCKAAFSDEFINSLSDINKRMSFYEYFSSDNSRAVLYMTVLTMLQHGYREKRGNDNIFGSEMELNMVPWCSILYHWLLKKTGEMYPGSVSPYTYSAKYSNSRYTFENAPVSTRQLAEIEPGYNVTWARNNNTKTGKKITGPGLNKRAGHTAICVHNDVERKILFTIEGNNRDGVTLVARYWRNINSTNLEFIGGCSYIEQGAGKFPVIVRSGTWTGSVKEDINRNYI